MFKICNQYAVTYSNLTYYPVIYLKPLKNENNGKLCGKVGGLE